MRLLDATLPTAAENLALDEVLLERVDEAEAATDPQAIGYLRVWEPTQPFVVVGRASRVANEVDLEFCQKNNVPIYRRCSGGATVVAMPDCLMYAVVLSLHRHPDLRMIEMAHKFVLEHVRSALRSLDVPAEMQGTSDLTIGDRKFSGNSLRCKRNAILYHGTILCNAELAFISQCLKTAPRQPDYRRGRQHAEFITNLEVDSSAVRAALVASWDAQDGIGDIPVDEVQRLVRDRYSSDAWNLRH